MSNESVYQRIKDLVKILNEATIAYDEGYPIMPDTEWDKMYFELKTLEEETGLILGDSPTQTIIYENVNALTKVSHNHKMLSLDKTKSISDIVNFLGEETFICMLKMDGLTCSLTYQDGKLVSAETRGNGLIGEDILHNALVIPSIPLSIPTKEKVVIDGEIICKTDDFEKFATEYKNPRNFAAGSIRLLDSKECASRKLTFVAWEVIQGLEEIDELSDKILAIKEWGFTTVPFVWRSRNIESIHSSDIEDLIEVAQAKNYPIDGIVFKFDNIKYGKSLGETGHHFKNAIAYKFEDETYPTKLLDIEWTMGRTGVLTPVAVFQPIDIDGSTVERASLHNISVMEETLGEMPHKWQKIEVFKANMIIPQIAWADKETHGLLYYYDYPHIDIPKECPICGGRTEERTEIDSTILYCTNSACEGKLINRLDHFCGKKGLDIKGLSKATLEKLIDWDWVKNYSDLFILSEYRNEWIKKAGFGPKSVDNILSAIKNSQTCDLDKFITALGIPLIGSTASKELVKQFDTWDKFREAITTNYHFDSIQNFGVEMNYSIKEFDYSEADSLVKNYISFNSITKDNFQEQNLENKTFVITGKLMKFKNRDELKQAIESRGGKVSSSVSKNTNYLINNDITSTSSKNKSAQAFNIPIITEENFISLFGIFD